MLEINEENRKVKAHVVLVYPAFIGENDKVIKTWSDNDLPLNVMLLGSVLLAHGYTVEVLNANMHPDFEERTLKSLERDDVAYVGFSCMSSQVKSAIKLSKKIKEAHPGVPIVMGGVHPTLMPESLVRTPWVDICVVGEGDAVVGKLVDYANDRVPLEEVPNVVASRDDGSILKTHTVPVSGFEILPNMMHESLYRDEIEKYTTEFQSDGVRWKRFVLMTGLGCKYKCAFCITHITNRPYRTKMARSIYNEMKTLKERFGINFFCFQEEHFFGDKERLFDLLDLIENDPDLYHKIRWVSTIRVSDIRDDYVNVDLLKRIREAGCAGFSTGGESGSDRVLRFLRKGIKPQDMIRVASYFNEAKLRIDFSFVMLWPGEELSDMVKTAQLLREIILTGPYAKIPYFQTYRPYPGSIWESDLSRFDNPESLPREIWRFQLVDKERMSAFEDPDLLYRIITTTQAMCITGYDPDAFFSSIKLFVRNITFLVCSWRIANMNFKFYIEHPFLKYIRKRHTQH